MQGASRKIGRLTQFNIDSEMGRNTTIPTTHATTSISHFHTQMREKERRVIICGAVTTLVILAVFHDTRNTEAVHLFLQHGAELRVVNVLLPG